MIYPSNINTNTTTAIMIIVLIDPLIFLEELLEKFLESLNGFNIGSNGFIMLFPIIIYIRQKNEFGKKIKKQRK